MSLRARVAERKAALAALHDEPTPTVQPAPPHAPSVAPPLDSVQQPTIAEAMRSLQMFASHSASLPAASVSTAAGSQLESVAYWHDFGRGVGLSCGESSHADESGSGHAALLPHFEHQREAMREAMRSDGYVEVEDWEEDRTWLDRMTRSFAAAIDALDAAGLPANFLLVFDEVWEAVDRLRAVLQPVLGHGLTYDFYVFNVQPGGTGWGMHRERAGRDAMGAFMGTEAPEGAQGLPAYNTVWLALTNASPKTSCMYCLPARADPGYRTVADQSAVGHAATAPHVLPADAVTPDPEDIGTIVQLKHQYIRALPVPAGTALAWSHRLIHWGSTHGGGAGPRQTLAFALADPNFEPPLLATPSVAPPLGGRLALIAHLLVRYHHEASHPAPLWPRTLEMALQLLCNHADHLSDAVRELCSPQTIPTSPPLPPSLPSSPSPPSLPSIHRACARLPLAGVRVVFCPQGAHEPNWPWHPSPVHAPAPLRRAAGQAWR